MSTGRRGNRAEAYEKELAVRESEAALQQSRERLQVTLSSIGDAVVSCDAAGRITFMNPKAEEYVGWTTEAAAGTPIQQVLRVVDEETGEPVEDIAAQVLRERSPVRRADHLALVGKDGQSIPIEGSAAPIRDAAGELTGVVLVFHSVTEQRRAQEQIRASERRYRTLVELSPEAVVVHLNGKIVYANAVALRLFGAKYREELQGRKMLELVHAELHDLVRERIGDVESGGMAPLRELRIVRLDGREVAVEATAGSIDWQGQVAVQSILRDITARKAAEALFVQTEKLASVGRMAASIAHEINNPLAAVMNTVYLARKTPEVPEPAVRYLEIAEDELKRVSHITRQVLGFYREGSALKQVAVDSIMESTLDLLQSKIRTKQAKIEKRYRGDLAITCGGRRAASGVLQPAGEQPGVHRRVRHGEAAHHRRPVRQMRGALGAHHGGRQRTGHPRGDPVAHVRSAVHHQRRHRHRAGAVGEQADCGEARRHDPLPLPRHGCPDRDGILHCAEGREQPPQQRVIRKVPRAGRLEWFPRSLSSRNCALRQLGQRLAEELFKAGAVGGGEFFQRLVGGGGLIAEIDERRKHIVFQPVAGTRRGRSHAELRQLVLEFEHHALGGFFAYAGHAGEPGGIAAAQGGDQVAGCSCLPEC